MSKEEQFKEHQRTFLKYAEKLFDYILPPEKNTLKLKEIDVNNNIECGLLYELFSYGFKRKMHEFIQASESETYKKDICRDPKKMFDFVAEYMKATGYYPVFDSFEKNDKGELININMKFAKNEID